jgi:hypothetical protein
LLSLIDRSSEKNIIKKTLVLNKGVNQMDFNRHLQNIPTAAEYTFFSAAHEKISKRDIF